jgi:hypothetical protein
MMQKSAFFSLYKIYTKHLIPTNFHELAVKIEYAMIILFRKQLTIGKQGN